MFTPPTLPTFVNLVTLAIGLSSGSCSDPPEPTDGKKQGLILGSALAKQVPKALSKKAPFRCNRTLRGTQIPAPLTKLGLTFVDGALTLPTEEKDTVTIAFVSDSRSAHPLTVAQITRLGVRLASEELDLIVSLGGMGTKYSDIKLLLSSLSSKNAPALIAFPGDRESVRQHRNAIDDLAKEDRAIADGSTFPLIAIGPVLVAGLAGIPRVSNLVAGNDGCVYDENDLAQFQKRLAGDGRKVVLASYAPLAGLTTARGHGGVPLGPEWTQGTATDSTFTAIVHGLVGSLGQPDSGVISAGSGQAIVAGELDPAAGGVDALLLSISARRTTWRRIRLP